MTSEHKRTGAHEAIERILNRGGDADDVLRDVVRELHRLYPYVALGFVEGGELVTGPALGGREGASATTRYPVVYQGRLVAELEVASSDAGDEAFLRRVATLISAHCLVGWDTGGAAWTP